MEFYKWAKGEKTDLIRLAIALNKQCRKNKYLTLIYDLTNTKPAFLVASLIILLTFIGKTFIYP